MRVSNFLHSFSRKLLLLLLAVCLLLLAGYFIWEKSKFAIIKNRIANIFLAKTDSLYTIHYDSLFYDEHNGDVFFKNIHITPDTVRVQKGLRNNPYLVLDIKISSLSIKGIKTGQALKGEQIIGDSIIITDPTVTAYILRKVKRETKIDAEAKNIYREIFHKLKLIQVAEVSVRNAQIHAINYFNHERQFQLENVYLQLHDVRIDSLHNEDTSRILFCKEGSFRVAHFSAFNKNREQLVINDVNYSGEGRRLTFSKLLLNRFDDQNAIGVPMVIGNNMIISGIDNFQVIRNKNITIDSIFCQDIQFYWPPSTSFNPRPIVHGKVLPRDTAGFRAAYSLDLKTIYFPAIEVLKSNSFTKGYSESGRFALKVREVNADQILLMQIDPMEYIKELDLKCPGISYVSGDGLYRNDFINIEYNSLRNQLSIGNLRIKPQLSEEAFTAKMPFQKDRYDVDIKNIILKEVNLAKIIEKQIFANEITASNGSIKIYRDVSKPLDGISKIGNYPQQLLIKSDIPIDIRHAFLNNFYIEYKEKNTFTGKAGTIKFNDSRITLSNITNVPSAIRSDGIATAELDTKVIHDIPFSVSFKFFLGDTGGKFYVKGNVGSFDMKSLNEISKTLALLEIDKGYMQNAAFDFSGNDLSTRGHLVMKYTDLKVALLKKDKAGVLSKRGFMSLFANVIIKDDNPHKGKLRDIDVEYDRDKNKSFFNLVWKTIFTGMKATVGLPGPKIK